MKKKAKAKPKAKTRDIELDYVRVPILSTVATEFKFKESSLIVILVPGVGMVVMGKDWVKNPAHCWRYSNGTSMKEAISETFKDILHTACEQMKVAKKVEKKA